MKKLNTVMSADVLHSRLTSSVSIGLFRARTLPLSFMLTALVFDGEKYLVLILCFACMFWVKVAPSQLASLKARLAKFQKK